MSISLSGSVRSGVTIYGLDKIQSVLDPSNFRKAASKAINETLFDLRSEYLNEFPKIFDRPNMNYLKKSFQIPTSTPESLFGILEIKDDNISKSGTRFVDVLRHHIDGSNRESKKFEKNLSYDSSIMSKSMIAAPMSGAKLDQYGGLDGKFNAMLLSYFGLYRKSGFDAAMSLKKKQRMSNKGTHWASKVRTGKTYKSINGVEYFMVGVGSRGRRGSPLKPGIYKRTGLHGYRVEPVMLFVRKKAYKKRFDFYGIAQRNVDQKFNDRLMSHVKWRIV